MSKQTSVQPVKVRGIDNADKNTKSIITWVNRIGELHKAKPLPTVNYSKNMPTIESLMQEWPPEFEQLLEKVILTTYEPFNKYFLQVKLPHANLDISLKQYSKLTCSVLDIPVYSNYIESLHLLFTLYSAFKENSHFGGQSEEKTDLLLNINSIKGYYNNSNNSNVLQLSNNNNNV